MILVGTPIMNDTNTEAIINIIGIATNNPKPCFEYSNVFFLKALENVFIHLISTIIISEYFI